MYYHRVLILVVMDDALALILFMTDIKVSLNVLILVVMDDALAQATMWLKTRTSWGLNPCCNG